MAVKESLIWVNNEDILAFLIIKTRNIRLRVS